MSIINKLFAVTLCSAGILIVQDARAATITIGSSSGATLHNDYWRGNWFSWNANSSAAWISSLECYGGCYWSGEKLFFEVPLPALTGNILSAEFHINVVAGGTGDAWFNTISAAGLTGDAYGDAASLQGGFNNSGLRVARSSAGWVSLEATTGVQQQYADGRSWGVFTFDPVPWSTSLTISDMSSGSKPYLTIVTDAPGAATPEPGTMVILGLGLLTIGARRFFGRR